jgi:hypothetical protein
VARMAARVMAGADATGCASAWFEGVIALMVAEVSGAEGRREQLSGWEWAVQ